MPDLRFLFVRSSRLAACGAVLAAAAFAAPMARTDPLAPGSPVRFSEDRTGGVWHVVGRYDLGRHMIRTPGWRGDVLCVAETNELSPLPPGERPGPERLARR